ncbi:MAG: MarC family protein [Longimicrobiales bacterium]|nr:MarC family protein [Longimicrobiales bacterium]
MGQFALFFASILSIVNPFAAIPVYLGVTADLPVAARRGLPRRTAAAAMVILLVAYAAGESLLSFFSISIAALRVAGGILIFAMAWSMLQARLSAQKQTPEEAEEASDRDSIAIVPLAMPLLAGPGSISVMILWATQSEGGSGHVAAVAAVIAVSLVIWVILSLAAPISTLLGRTGMNVATRFMGLILAAVAVEFITGGLQELFPGWAGGIG